MRTFGPNVICFQLVTGSDRFFVVGAYIPPSSDAELEEVRKAVKQCPTGLTPWFIGDLNVDLESPPGDERGMDIAEEVDAMDVVCMSRQFRQRRRRRVQGRWTWRMRRQGRWVSSHPNYFLCPTSHRCKFRKVGLRTPWHYTSDHRAIVAQIFSGSPRKLKEYRRRQSRFPIRLDRVGPRSKQEAIFEELQANCIPPPPRARIANSWISEGTWQLVDHRSMLRRRGMLGLSAK